jgi:hypothetical protein
MKKIVNILGVSLLALSVQACTTAPQARFMQSSQCGVTQVKPLHLLYQTGNPAPNLGIIGGNNITPDVKDAAVVEDAVPTETGDQETDRFMDLLKYFVEPIVVALITRP